MKKNVACVTNAELDKALNDIAQFYDFTFFSERNTEETTVMVFIIEFIACALDLVHDEPDADDDDYDGFVMLEKLVLALDTRARQNSDKRWEKIRNVLPYSTKLQLTPAP